MQYSIADLERLAAGQGSKIGTSRSQTRNVPITSLPSFRRDVRHEILLVLRLRTGQMSRAEIARALKLKKSTWLNSLIEELVDKGHLRRIAGVYKNGVVMYFYEVPR